MSLSTHVLDTVAGRPASDVEVALCRVDDTGRAERVATARTDSDGRISGWTVTAGRHRLVFGTGDYWRRAGVDAFHPEVAVTFDVTAPDAHHHVPLLLAPFAYSTYRGS